MNNASIGFDHGLSFFVAALLIVLLTTGMAWLVMKKRNLAKQNSVLFFGIISVCLVVFGFVFYSLQVSNSNLPKHQLSPDYSAEENYLDEQKAKPLSPVTDLSPATVTAEESTQRLEELRQTQKEEIKKAD